MKRALLVAVAVLALAALAAGCGGGDEAPAPTTTPTATEAAPAETTAPETVEPETGAAETGAAETGLSAECAPELLAVVEPGVLTIGTGNPAYPPWFGGEPEGEWKISNPASGEGYESAVAYAVAERLGLARDQVAWVPVPFTKSFAPGPKDFDFVLQQISYTPKRARAVDFSDSYYDVNQALVTLKGSELEGATSFADLKDAVFGVPVGTTSYDYVVGQIAPDREPRVYDDQAGAIQALKNGQVDGIVADLPTAYYLTAVELEDGVIVGQFPSVGGQEYFAMAFEKGSPLVSCVNEALAAIKADGTLEAIHEQWLAGQTAPFINP